MKRGWLAPAIGAFLSGIGYIGLHVLNLEPLVTVVGNQKTAIYVSFYLIVITLLVACYIFEARPSRTPDRSLRWSGLAILLSQVFGFFMLRWLVEWDIDPIFGTWLAAALLMIPAATAGVAYGWFFQIVLRHSYVSTFISLIAVAAGSLLAGPRAKILVSMIGPTLAFALVLSAFVTVVMCIPASEEDEPRTTASNS